MFAVLCVTEGKKGFMRWIFRKKPKVVVQTIGNVEYIKIIAKKYGDKLDYKKIEKIARKFAGKILIPSNIKTNINCNLDIFTYNEFMQQVLINTALTIIKNSGQPAKNISVFLYDKSGEFMSTATELLKVSGTVKVATNETDDYENFSDEMLNQCGAALIINNDISKFNLLLAPAGIDDEIPAICIGDLNKRYEIKEDLIKIGAGFSRYVPENISECAFAAALSTYPEFKRLKWICANYLYSGGKKVDIKDIKI